MVCFLGPTSQACCEDKIREVTVCATQKSLKECPGNNPINNNFNPTNCSRHFRCCQLRGFSRKKFYRSPSFRQDGGLFSKVSRTIVDIFRPFVCQGLHLFLAYLMACLATKGCYSYMASTLLPSLLKSLCLCFYLRRPWEALCFSMCAHTHTHIYANYLSFPFVVL